MSNNKQTPLPLKGPGAHDGVARPGADLEADSGGGGDYRALRAIKTIGWLAWLGLLAALSAAACKGRLHAEKAIPRAGDWQLAPGVLVGGAFDRRQLADWQPIYLAGPPAPRVNLALDKPCRASTERGVNRAGLAVDQRITSRWESDYSDHQWWRVDLERVYPIDQVTIQWERAYGRRYTLEGSHDGRRWTVLYREEAGDGHIDDLRFDPTPCRYLRLVGRQRATPWGYSFYEFAAYATRSGPPPIHYRRSGGSHGLQGGGLTLGLAEPRTIYGLYHRRPVGGHFYAEATFERDAHLGLALLFEKDGRPDPQNFVMITVDTIDGRVVTAVHDCQAGRYDVLDHTRRAHPLRYQHRLDGQTYSLPFVGTAKKLRIFHETNGGFFHFYYAVKKWIDGRWVEGWSELAPLKSWRREQARFFVALVGRSGRERQVAVRFSKARLVPVPAADRPDGMAGFDVARREYNWSGFLGEALVVTFGDEFSLRAEQRKFVFWSALNYVPAWQLSEQCLMVYEFVETWGGGNPGCHEPMSDRLLRWSRVAVVEDNPVRKVIRWRYVLANPDYRLPDAGRGRQRPYADELYTIYPDGTILRRIRYFPKLDTAFRNWHELSELIVVAGSRSDPADHLASPALSLLDLGERRQDYHPGPRLNARQLEGWPQVIQLVHLKGGAESYQAFSQTPEIPETYAHYPLTFELSWHDLALRMSHWPVGLEPYHADADKSFTTWRGEVSHASLMGVGVTGGTDWQDHLQRLRSGRKYRQWVTLLGLATPGDTREIQQRVSSWLHPPGVEATGPGCSFLRYDVVQRQLIFKAAAAGGSCRFVLYPRKKGQPLINPAISILGWRGRRPLVRLDGRPARYRWTVLKGQQALVWIQHRASSSRVVIDVMSSRSAE